MSSRAADSRAGPQQQCPPEGAFSLQHIPVWLFRTQISSSHLAQSSDCRQSSLLGIFPLALVERWSLESTKPPRIPPRLNFSQQSQPEEERRPKPKRQKLCGVFDSSEFPIPGWEQPRTAGWELLSSLHGTTSASGSSRLLVARWLLRKNAVPGIRN